MVVVAVVIAVVAGGVAGVASIAATGTTARPNIVASKSAAAPTTAPTAASSREELVEGEPAQCKAFSHVVQLASLSSGILLFSKKTCDPGP